METNKVIKKHMRKLFEKLIHENYTQSDAQANRLSEIVTIQEEIKEKYPDAWPLVLKLTDLESEYLADQEIMIFKLTTLLNKAFLPLMDVDFKKLGGVKRG